jgi:hypothetical protein
MIVGIAEIDALAACRPVHLAFDCDAARDEMLLPHSEILFRYGERDVQLACGVVRRNHAAGRGDRFQSSAASKNKENLSIRHAEHAEPIAGFEQPQTELLLVEANRAGKIVRVKAGFNDAVDARGGHDFSGKAEREIPWGVYPGPFRGRNGNIPDFVVENQFLTFPLVRQEEVRKCGIQEASATPHFFFLKSA